jgi:hypothetical protein
MISQSSAYSTAPNLWIETEKLKSLGFCFLKKYIPWDEKDTYVTQHAPVCHPLETHYDSSGD